MIQLLKKYYWVLAIFLIPIYFFYNPSNLSLFPKCPFFQITGYYCPGCGSQRAIYDILHFNFINALSHNTLMILILFFGFSLYLISKESYLKLKYNPKTPTILFIIIMSFWILRNLKTSPFNWLDPN